MKYPLIARLTIPTPHSESVASRPMLDGSLGTISSVQHLTPFRAPVPSHTAPVPEQGQQQVLATPAPAAMAMTAPATAAIVGDGMVAVCSSTGVHVAIVRPWGDLVQLFSRGSWAPEEDEGGGGTSMAGAAAGAAVTRPAARPAAVARPGVLPTAAWMPHAPRGGGGGGGGDEDIIVPSAEAVPACPIAVLAVGWDRRVVFYDVPLVGDLPIAPGGDRSGKCRRQLLVRGRGLL